MDKRQVIERIRHGLIVSCQALEGEPLYRPEGGVMPLMAEAARRAGAVGIRANGVQDIRDIMARVDLPLIGIIKKNYPGSEAYITPTMDEVDQLVDTGCAIIALDCTRQSRPGGLTSREFLRQVRAKYPGQLFMADCSALEDAVMAAEEGIDFVGTTLNGYVKGDEAMDGPNFELARRIVEKVPAPLIAEGRIHRPEEARAMLELGALAVVVGGAITRPLEIARRFVTEIEKAQLRPSRRSGFAAPAKRQFICLRRDRLMVPSCMESTSSRLLPVP